MSEEDINFLISIQDLEQPEFDNACLERENERLRNQLQQKENIIKEVREYLKNLTNFQIGYGLNENDIKRTMYASENNFVKDILEILDKGE